MSLFIKIKIRLINKPFLFQQNLGDLCKGIVQNEVKLTIEINADETISMLREDMEESQMFLSLCSEQDNESYFGGESFMPVD